MVLDYLIAICGFVGGWLLVAGPVWQAALELAEEEIDQEAIEHVKQIVQPPPPVLALVVAASTCCIRQAPAPSSHLP